MSIRSCIHFAYLLLCSDIKLGVISLRAGEWGPASNLSNGSALIEMVWPCLIRLKKSHLWLSRPSDQVTFVWPCLIRPINLSESHLFPHSSHLRNDEPFKTELIAIGIDSKPDEITWAKLKNEAALVQRECKEIVLNVPLIMPYPFFIFL